MPIQFSEICYVKKLKDGLVSYEEHIEKINKELLNSVFYVKGTKLKYNLKIFFRRKIFKNS
jgi:hypothetical protein